MIYQILNLVRTHVGIELNRKEEGIVVKVEVMESTFTSYKHEFDVILMGDFENLPLTCLNPACRWSRGSCHLFGFLFNCLLSCL